jgi:molybdopterin converting factor small subunit
MLFAHVRERFGPLIEVEAEPNAASILHALAGAGVPVESCRLAAGDEFLRMEDTVSARQELALIPPVSGG